MILPPSDSDLPEPRLWQLAVTGAVTGGLLTIVAVTVVVSIGGLWR